MVFWKVTKPEEYASKKHLLPMTVSIMGCIALALTLVWLNVERTRLAYTVRQLQQQEVTQKDIYNSLLVQRENLLTPQSLDRIAERLGLYTARPGQIRRLDNH